MLIQSAKSEIRQGKNADDILLVAPSVASLQQLLHLREQELARFDMPLNVKKSACMRVGSRFNAKCANIVTREGRELSWVNSIRYLGFILSQLHPNARLTLLNVLSIVHSTQFLVKLDELPQMK